MKLFLLPYITLSLITINAFAADVYVSAGNTNPEQNETYYTFYRDANATIPFDISNGGSESLIVGESYTFRRLSNLISHPFYISDSGYKQASSSTITLSGNGSASTGIIGTQNFTLTIENGFDPASDTLSYFSTAHDLMIGTFNVSQPVASANDLSLGISNFGSFQNNPSEDDHLVITASNNGITFEIGPNTTTNMWDGYGISSEAISGLNDPDFGASDNLTDDDALSAWKFGNSGNQVKGDIKITNSTNQDFKLRLIHFDYYVRESDRKKLELLYLATNSNMVKVANGEQSNPQDFKTIYQDYPLSYNQAVEVSRSLGEAFEGQAWIPAGGSATFRFVFKKEVDGVFQTNASNDLPFAYIDNIQIEGSFGSITDALIDTGGGNGNGGDLTETVTPITWQELETEFGAPISYVGVQDFAPNTASNNNNLVFTKTENNLTLSIGPNTTYGTWDGYGVSSNESLDGLNDSTFGSRIIPDTLAESASAWKFGNSGNQRKGDIRITNNGTTDFKFTHIHFDARNAYGTNHPTDLALIYLAEPSGSNLIKGSSSDIGTELANLKLLYSNNWTASHTVQVNQSMGAAIEGTAWIKPGESAVLRFIWSGNSDIGTGNGETQIDNIAIRGTFLSEPISASIYTNELNNLQIEWSTNPAKRYNLLSSTEPDGDYTLVENYGDLDANTNSATINFSDTLEPKKFYKVEEID